MKTLGCFCLLVFALLCKYTLEAQDVGDLGFTIKTSTVYDRLNNKTYNYCFVVELLPQGPAYKANFYSIDDVIYAINGKCVFINKDSLEGFSSYDDLLKSKLKCKAGDVMEITTINPNFFQKVWHGGYEINGLPEKISERKYSIIAASKSEIEKKWKEYEKNWDDEYESFQMSPETRKILKVKKEQIGNLSNPKFAHDFAHNVDVLYLLIDTGYNHPIDREYVKNALKSKGYDVYFFEYGTKSDSRTFFANESIADLKRVATIELICGVDKTTDRYSMDVSREYARYVDNHGNSITEYRPQKENWTVTKREINGYVYVALPRRATYLHKYTAPLHYVYKEKIKITTGKPNWADVALKSILAEIPDKK